MCAFVACGHPPPNLLSPSFLTQPHPPTTPCPLSCPVFFLVPVLFLSVCVCVGDGGWAQCFRLFSEFVSVVPPVAITPPPPTPAGLGPASFLPVPRTHPSVLSSSSSSSCCCCCKVDGKASEGFTNHTPPLCFVACPSLFCCVCCVLCGGLVGMVGGGVGCHATLV